MKYDKKIMKTNDKKDWWIIDLTINELIILKKMRYKNNKLIKNIMKTTDTVIVDRELNKYASNIFKKATQYNFFKEQFAHRTHRVSRKHEWNSLNLANQDLIGNSLYCRTIGRKRLSLQHYAGDRTVVVLKRTQNQLNYIPFYFCAD